MYQAVKKNIMNEKETTRIIFSFIFFFAVFSLITCISYYLLPQGFLFTKNSLLDWETPDNSLLAAFQIFAFNGLSVIAIVIANFFLFPNKENPLSSMGYYILFIQFVLNAITLGTWSFTAVKEIEPELIYRFMRVFSIQRAGIWEMSGQLLIACATARMAILREGKEDIFNYQRRCKKLSKTEILIIIIGITFMVIGAYIEARNIIRA